MVIKNKSTAEGAEGAKKNTVGAGSPHVKINESTTVGKEQKTMNVGEKITGHTCLGSEIIRKWIFYAETHDDEAFYLDDLGNEIDYSEAMPFVGNNHDAALEAERRANLWEDGKNGLLAEIYYETQGIL